MKHIYILFLVLITVQVRAQTKHHLYSSVQAVGYTTKEATGGGPHLSIGYHDNGIGFGPGVGLILIGADNPLVPVYFNFIYSGSVKKKFSPMTNFHIGKMFYKGWGSFIGEDAYLIAGFYANVSGGVAMRVKKSKVHAFCGITLISFKNTETATNFHQSIFNGGVGFFFVD